MKNSNFDTKLHRIHRTVGFLYLIIFVLLVIFLFLDIFLFGIFSKSLIILVYLGFIFFFLISSVAHLFEDKVYKGEIPYPYLFFLIVVFSMIVTLFLIFIFSMFPFTYKNSLLGPILSVIYLVSTFNVLALYFYSVVVRLFILIFKKLQEIKNENNIEVKRIKYLGLKYYRKGKYNKALIAFQEVLNIEPKDSITWSNLGAVYNKLGSYSKAVDALKQSIIYEDAEDPYTRNHLGYAYIKQSRYDEAIKTLKVALEIESQFDQALYNLADIYLKMGHYEKALEYIEKCLKINPTLKKAKKLKEYLKKKENLFQS